MNTATTVVTDDESASGIESPAPTHAASREDIGAALLRLNGEQPSEPAPRVFENAGAEDDQPAQENAADQALTSDDDADQEEPTSRRGKATIRELRDEVERLKAQIAEPKPAPQSAPEPEPEDDQLKVIQELRGDDAEYKRLHQELLDGTLSFMDTERYRKMTVAREFEKEWQTVGERRANAEFSKYRNGFLEGIANHFTRISTRPGVDPDFVKSNPDMGAVFDHIYEAGRSALADENEQLKGELKELKAKQMGQAPRLATGGRSSMGLKTQPDPRESEPQELIAAGFAQRSRSGARR